MSYDFLKVLEDNNGYWKHKSGQKYLAELTSGKISDTFCNTGVITTDPKLLNNVVEHLLLGILELKPVFKITYSASDIIRTAWQRRIGALPNFVIGPAFGGIALSYEVARILGAKALFTEPLYKANRYTSFEEDLTYGKEDVWIEWHEGRKPTYHWCQTDKIGQKFRFDLPDDARVLFVEDVITTGQSTKDMVSCVERSMNGRKWDITEFLCLVNRSGKIHISLVCPKGSRIPEELREAKIHSLANVHARTWDILEDAQKDLPEVIEAIKPKMNWTKLTAVK